jgi:glutaminase
LPVQAPLLGAGDSQDRGEVLLTLVVGGIVAVSPGKSGIAVVSPSLDDAGNSVRAQRPIADISKRSVVTRTERSIRTI